MCQSIKINASVRDTGAKGGNTVNEHNPVVSWNYVTTQANSTASQDIKQRLRSITATYVEWTAAEADTLFPPGLHTFTVSYLATTGKTLESNASFTKIGNKPPTATFNVENPTVEAYADRPLSIVATVLADPCISARGVRNTGAWKLVGGTYSTAPASSGSGVSLSFPSGSLEMGATYIYNLTAQTFDSQDLLLGEVSHHTPVTIITQVTKVTANIAGGVARTISTYGSYSFKIKAAGTLDAATGKMPKLTWTIICVSGCTTNTVTPEVVNNGTIRLNNTQFEPEKTYTVSLLAVGKTIFGKLRNVTATQTITTTALPKPAVVLSLKGENQNLLQLPTANRVILSASVVNFQKTDVTFSWACTTNNLNLGDPAIAASGMTGYNMVLNRGAIRSGITYAFAVNATHSTGSTGSADITVRGLVAPSGGSCSSTPSSGASFDTVFELACTNWSAVNTPIYYAFSGIMSEGAQPFAICTSSPQATCNTTLPIVTGPSITIRIEIADFLGEATTRELQVGISSATADVSALASRADDAAKSGDVKMVSMVVAGTAAYLGMDTSMSATERANARQNLLQSMSTVRNNSVSLSKLDAVSTPLGLLSQVINASASSDEVTQEARELGLSMLKSVTSDSLNDFSEGSVKATIGCLDGIISSRPSGVNNTSGDSSIGSVLEAVGKGISADSVAGEKARTFTSEKVNIAVQKTAIGSLGSTAVSAGSASFALGAISATDVGAIASSGDDDEGADDIGLVASSMKLSGSSSMYGRDAKGSSDVATLSLVQAGGALNVSNLTTPITISFTKPQAASGTVTAVCKYWDEANQSWSTKGVTSGTYNSATGGVDCETTHLTSFAVEFEVNINTFDASDVDAAFSFDNPFLTTLTSTLVFFIAMAMAAYAYDSKIRSRSTDQVADNFWRRFNRLRRVRVKGADSRRTVGNFKEVICWGFGRRHPWVSICLRDNGDFIDSFKRVVILAVLVFNTMAVCVLLLDQDQKLFGLPKNIAISLVAMAFSFPMPFVVAKLFKRRVPPHMMLKIEDGNDIMGCFGNFMLILGLCCGDLSLDDLMGGEDGEAEEEADDGGDGGEDGDEEDVDGGVDGGVEDDFGNDAGENNNDEDAAVVAGAAGGGVMGAATGSRRIAARQGVHRDQAVAENKALGRKTIQVSATAQRGNRTEGEKILRGTVLDLDLSDSSDGSTGDSEPDWDAKARSKAKEVLHKEFPKRVVVARVVQLDAKSVETNNDGEDLKAGNTVDDEMKVMPGAMTSLKLVPEDEPHSDSQVIEDAGEPIGHEMHFRMDSSKPKLPVLERSGFKRTADMPICTSNMRFGKQYEGDDHMEHDFHTHVYTWYDYFGVVVSFIIVVGCWFIAVVLSFKLKQEYDNFYSSSVLSYLQDISYRMLQITILESLVFFPWCAICCFCCCTKEPKYDRPVHVATVTAGYIGFYFQGLTVSDVDDQSPAELAGIRNGMRILSVDGTQVDNDKDCLKALDAAHKTMPEFEIVLEKPSWGDSSDLNEDAKENRYRSNNLPHPDASTSGSQNSSGALEGIPLKVLGEHRMTVRGPEDNSARSAISIGSRESRGVASGRILTTGPTIGVTAASTTASVCPITDADI